MTSPTFSEDWFSQNIPLFQRHLAPLAHQENLRFLEIGCFEGRSSCWLLQNILTHPSCELTCVDTFRGNLEHRKRPGGLEGLFAQNIEAIGATHRVRAIKGLSEEVLRTLPRQYYDFIYIDGSHFAPDVLSDAVLSWPLLKLDGLLLFDDYEWAFYKHPRHNPKTAVDAFITIFTDELSVLETGWQLLVRKHQRIPQPFIESTP